jgi:hypothetical protein
MATSSPLTPIDHTSDAGFRTWGNELMTALITTLGLTQTTDTGQLAFPMTVTTRPAINTAAGYYIIRFNDTLQSTVGVFIKVELGTFASATVPGLWITVGTGTDGAGNITGGGVRTACGLVGAATSAVVNFQSRACYLASQGVLWVDWKQGASLANESQMGFVIQRSVDNTGAPTSAAVGFMGMATNATAVGNSLGLYQWYNASSTTWLGPTASGGLVWSAWGYVPFNATNSAGASSLVGTAGQVFPCFQYAPTASVPALGVTNAVAMCYQTEIPTGATVSLNILGSTTLTYISGLIASAGWTVQSYGIGIFGILRVWQ